MTDHQAAARLYEIAADMSDTENAMRIMRVAKGLAEAEPERLGDWEPPGYTIHLGTPT